jgi:hypothetical protein
VGHIVLLKKQEHPTATHAGGGWNAPMNTDFLQLK